MSKLEADFLTAWQSWPGLQEPEREHRFHPTRKWRFDFAWPSHKLAVEIEGGGGRHHSYAGHHADCDKYNAAVALGWRVLKFTGKHIKSDPDGMVEVIIESLGELPAPAAE